MNSPFLLEEVIRFSDCDPAGICYFGTFSTFFDESFIALARKAGIGWDEHHTLNFLIPIVQTETKFYSPLKSGDLARIYTTLTKIGNRSFTSSHLITVIREDKEVKVASGYISRVTVDYSTFQPRTIPDPLKLMLEQNAMTDSEWISIIESYSSR